MSKRKITKAKKKITKAKKPNKGKRKITKAKKTIKGKRKTTKVKRKPIRAKKKTVPKYKKSNLYFGLAQEKIVAKEIIKQNAGVCISMQNKRTPHDIMHTSNNGIKTAWQVKASRVNSKHNNTCTKEEKERLIRYGKDNNINSGFIQKKGKKIKYTYLYKKK